MFGEPMPIQPKLSWYEMETLPEYYSYLIDYGLSHTYLQQKKDLVENQNHLPAFLRETEKEHIENVIGKKPYNCFKGNLLFQSKHAFEG